MEEVDATMGINARSLQHQRVVEAADAVQRTEASGVSQANTDTG